jgi:hypothetical protein
VDVPAIFVFGTLLGWLMWRTGSLALTWFAHGCFNLVAYIELCVTRDPRSVRIETWASQPWVWLPSLALFAAWLVTEARRPVVGFEPSRSEGNDDPVPGSRLTGRTRGEQRSNGVSTSEIGSASGRC